MESNAFVRYTFDSWKYFIYLIKECRGLNYGYGCNQSCQCVYGICDRNATDVNQSCTCNPGYQPPFCVQLIDRCGKNNYFVNQFIDYY